MPSLTLDNRMIWFAHCPKAGGTSIEQLMVATWGNRVGHLHWGWDLWWKQGGWRSAKPPNSPQHLTWADAAQTVDPLPTEVFAMVRDPATRMMSEYRYQRRHRRGTWAGRILARLPFSVWLRLMLAVARKNPHAFDNHLRPQSDFIPAHAVVFRLEDGLQPAVRWLAKATDCPDLGLPGHVLASGRSAAPDADSQSRISEAFLEDYKRFGYPLPDIERAPKDWRDPVFDMLARLVIFLDRRGRL